MALKFPYRDIFYHKVLRPKRLFAVLVDLDERITSATGSETGLSDKITALETAVGNSDSGVVKDVNDLKTAVGNSDSGVVKDVNDLKAEVGDESTEGTILARIKALEDAQ